MQANTRTVTKVSPQFLFSKMHIREYQETFYAIYKLYFPGLNTCDGSYINVYNSDLNEARIEATNKSIASSKCYKNAQGQYDVRNCNSTTGVESISYFSSPDCMGSPTSISTIEINTNFCDNQPPLMYMGCTSSSNTAINKGYKDVSTAGVYDLNLWPSIVGNRVELMVRSKV